MSRISESESSLLVNNDDNVIYSQLNTTASYSYPADKKAADEIEEATVVIPEDDIEHEGRFSWRKFWSFTGPGWLMSIAYLDPGNLQADLQAGAVAGYELLWVLFWATCLGCCYQILALRIGVVTGRDMASLCREEYPRWSSVLVWLMTEIAIIASDIQEVVGSAIALNILFGIPLWAGVIVTALDTFTFLAIHYFGVRKLEALFAALISTMAICFAVEFFLIGPSGLGILKGVAVPIVRDDNIIQAVGMLGAVIMPHNIFLHSALVLSRKVDRTSKSKVREANFYFSLEAVISLGVSFFINMFIVAVFAKLREDPRAELDDIGLSGAGTELARQFGKSARYIWAVGLLAAGQSSTMTGTFAGQYVMQGFLKLNIAPWLRVLITRSVALVPALIVALIAHDSLDSLSENLNVLQSIQLPFAVLPLIIFNSSKRIMGDFHLRLRGKVFFWTMVAVIVGSNIYLTKNYCADNLPHTPAMYFGIAVFSLLYMSFLVYLCLQKHSSKIAGSMRSMFSPRSSELK